MTAVLCAFRNKTGNSKQRNSKPVFFIIANLESKGRVIA
jgi:hypothetical protein